LNGDGGAQEYTGNIDLEGGQGNTINDAGLIAESGDIQLIADSGELSITGDSTSLPSTIIQALDGNVELTSEGTTGGTISVTYGDLEADNGDVDLTASGDVTISDSIISASGNVNLTSDNGSLDINEGRTSFDSNFDTGIDIYAQGSLSLSAVNVSVQQASLYSLYGDLDITGDGGNVTVSDSQLASDYGNVDLDAEDGILTVDEGSVSQGVYIEADDSVILNGDNGVSISDSYLQADNGDIQVTSGFGGVDIENSDLIAENGNINISADGDIALSGSGSEAEVYAYNGGISLTSYNGQVALFDEDIESEGDIDITAGSSISETLLPSAELTLFATEIYSHTGSVDLYSAEDALVFDSEILAQNNVTIESGGNLVIGEPVPLSLDTPLEISDSVYVSTEYGTVSLTSDSGDVDISDSELDAGGKLFSITANDGTVDIENSDIAVGYDGSSTAEGIDISQESDITASGNVYIEAHGGTVDISGGNVYINDSTFYFGNSITIDSSDITAQDGDVDIATDGTLSIDYEGSESLIDVGLSGGAITISDSSITAESGNVNIDTEFSVSGGLSISGTDIDISGSDITAAADTSTGLIGGIVTISTLGNISITDDTTVEGWNGVNLGGGEIGLEDTGSSSGYGDIYIDSSYIFAGSDSTVGGADNNIDADINAGGNVSIEDSSEIYAYNNVNISSGEAFRVTDFDASPSVGGIGIEDSYVAAGYDNTTTGGDVNLHAYGSNVYLNDDLVTAASGTSADGDINVTANTDIDVIGSGLDTDGQVSLTADNGYVNVLNSFESPDLTISDWDISAGSYADITANDNLTISSSTINAYDGNVNLKSGSVVLAGGPVLIYDTIVENDSSIDASGTVAVTATQGDVGIYDSTVTADTGDVNINATRNVDIENSTLSADYPTEIDYGPGTANGSTYESATTIDLSSTGGTINISGGAVTLFNDTIDLGTDININSASLTADTGDVDMTTGLFNVTGQTVDISGCTFAGGSILVNSSDVQATAGNVNMTAGQNINIEGNSTIAATPGGSDSDYSGGVYTSSSTTGITADGGDINLTAVNNVVLNSSTFDLGGDINIASTDMTSTGGDVDLTAGELNITAGGMIDYSSCTVNGGEINISGNSEITSTLGNVNMIAEDVNISDSVITAGASVDISAAGSVDISSDGSVCSITSDGTSSGNGVTITAANGTGAVDGITVSDATIDANTGIGTVTLNNKAGQVLVNGGTTIQTAYLNINSGDGILIDGTGGHLSGNTMNLTTGSGTVADDLSGDHTITVENTDLSGFATVNVAAHTVNLNNDNFSSTKSYNFDSFYGNYYINHGGSVAGSVNFNNDMLDGTTAIVPNGGSTTTTVNPNNNGGIGIGGSGAGIHIGTSPQ
jgi:hypothetical protein